MEQLRNITGKILLGQRVLTGALLLIFLAFLLLFRHGERQERDLRQVVEGLRTHTDALTEALGNYNSVLFTSSLRKEGDIFETQEILELAETIRNEAAAVAATARESQEPELIQSAGETVRIADYYLRIGNRMPHDFKTGYEEGIDTLAALNNLRQQLSNAFRELENRTGSWAERHRSRTSDRAVGTMAFLLLFSACAVAVSLLIFLRHLKLRALRNLLEQMVEEKTRALHELNATLEQRVREAVEEAHRQQEMMFRQARFAQMGEMLSMIAHQWRQPLNAISASTIHIQIDLDLDRLEPENVSQCARFIESQCSAMSDTINEFMNFFSPDTTEELFCLKEAVEGATAIILPQLRNRGILLETRCLLPVPVRGSRKEMEQVVLNLIANARDALEEKEEGVKEIRIHAFSTETQVVLEVADTGKGIAQPALERLFDPYFTTKPPGKGTGIGLYLCKSVVERHFCGTITGENHREGALFRIQLPPGADSSLC